MGYELEDLCDGWKLEEDIPYKELAKIVHDKGEAATPEDFDRLLNSRLFNLITDTDHAALMASFD